ncbi:hypothetical protein N7453_006341 [Penicillium expansum]|nr:hypothetical protein N7453_006341 [Penicillium expansum]
MYTLLYCQSCVFINIDIRIYIDEDTRHGHDTLLRIIAFFRLGLSNIRVNYDRKNRNWNRRRGWTPDTVRFGCPSLSQDPKIR